VHGDSVEKIQLVLYISDRSISSFTLLHFPDLVHSETECMRNHGRTYGEPSHSVISTLGLCKTCLANNAFVHPHLFSSDFDLFYLLAGVEERFCAETYNARVDLLVRSSTLFLL
jgi:hypothetical protein